MMLPNIPSEAKRYNHLIAEIDAAYHEAALIQGFSDSVMLILYTVAEHGGNCRIRDITGAGISKQTVNSALRKLECDGVIVLESEGRKSKRIFLTEKGRALTKSTVEKIIAIENRIFGSWKPEEWALYLDLTERFLINFKEEIKELANENHYHQP